MLTGHFRRGSGRANDRFVVRVVEDTAQGRLDLGWRSEGRCITERPQHKKTGAARCLPAQRRALRIGEENHQWVERKTQERRTLW